MREAGFLISRIHQVSGRVFARKLREYNIDINPSQGRILFVLWQNDGISMKDLAKRTSLGKSTLTSMLDRLEDEGHIKRIPDKKDRRRIIVKRSKKDFQLEELYKDVSSEMNELYYSGFSEEESDEFEGFLNRILKNLENYTP